LSWGPLTLTAGTETVAVLLEDNAFLFSSGWKSNDCVSNTTHFPIFIANAFPMPLILGSSVFELAQNL
jgi:hypothetical protein